MPIPPKTPLIALMRLEAKHVAALNKILAVAIADLDKQIKKMGSDNPITIMQARAQREAMNDFMNRTFDSMEDVARLGMSEAAVAASRVVSQYEDELLKLVLDKSTMANLAKSEANRAAAGLNAALKRMQGTSYVPLSQTVYKTKQLAGGWVDDLINKALASGWSRQRLAQELRKSIDPKVPGGVSYAANRTARTEINNAFHAASADRYMNSVIVEGVDWHLSSSHPEGDICDQLEADSPYPKKEVPKKPHPNCYCYITPHLPTEDEFLDNLFAGKYDDGAPWATEAQASGGQTMSAEEMAAGMSKAESARKSMERMIYTRGNLNKARGWNSDTYRARTSYTEMGHQDMNMLLRDPDALAAMFADDPYWIELAAKNNQLMIDVLAKNPTDVDMVVARGVLVTDKFNPGTLKVGESFADPAFLSTTTNLDEALNFAAGRGRVDNAEGWTFITKVPRGTNAVPGADYQNEIVFGPGQMQRVTGIDEDKRLIYTEMVS